jgi:hypothetical protein
MPGRKFITMTPKPDLTKLNQTQLLEYVQLLQNDLEAREESPITPAMLLICGAMLPIYIGYVTVVVRAIIR